MTGWSARTWALRRLIGELGPLLVAFSGGVDSTVLLKLALDELGRDGVMAVTAHGDVHTAGELEAAREAAARLGARHWVITTKELEVPGFAANPPERCFLCRSALYSRLADLARTQGMKAVVDGGNTDDGADYRPGIRAAKALGVRSPLAESGFSKDEVRALARELGLPNWDLPSSPCLASRFPYGEIITRPKLARVAAAERYLRDQGFRTVRVRDHGDVARVEVEEAEVGRAAEAAMRRAVVEHLRGLGYPYVALDLQGFRSGSMNETLQPAADKAVGDQAQSVGRPSV